MIHKYLILTSNNTKQLNLEKGCVRTYICCWGGKLVGMGLGFVFVLFRCLAR